jgi:hypothetical protein
MVVSLYVNGQWNPVLDRGFVEAVSPRDTHPW